MAALKYWNGSAWVTIPNGTALKWWDGNSWENPTALKYWNGSSWVTVWQKAAELTLGWNPIWTASYADSGGGYAKPAYTFPSPTDIVIQGDWEGIGVSGGMGDAHGVMYFDCAAIRTAMGGRLVCKSARLRLTNDVSNEPSGTPVHLYGVNDCPTSEPTTYNVAADRTSSKIDGPTIDEGVTAWTNFDATFINYVEAILAGSNHGFCVFDPGGNPTFRGYFHGKEAAASAEPYLEITADFV